MPLSRTEPGVFLGALHQVAQRALDLDRSGAFYRDVLEMPFIARFDPPGLAFFNLGKTRLLLEHGASTSTLYLRVADIHGTYAVLRGRVVVFLDEPRMIHRDGDGQFGPAGEEEWMAFFGDPADNLLALVERRTPTNA